MGLPLSGGDSGPPGLVLNFGILGSHAGACEDACCSAPVPDGSGVGPETVHHDQALERCCSLWPLGAQVKASGRNSWNKRSVGKRWTALRSCRIGRVWTVEGRISQERRNYVSELRAVCFFFSILFSAKRWRAVYKMWDGIIYVELSLRPYLFLKLKFSRFFNIVLVSGI